METSKTPIHTKNTKIMVNFTDGLIVQCNDHSGSKEFRALLELGYVEVGMIKGTPKIFWEPEYFNPEHKYLSR